MAALTDAELDAARARGGALQRRESRAAAAFYDRDKRQVVINLTNGCTFSFPPHLAQGLEEATDEQLAKVEVLGTGYGLHWDDLDVHLSIPSLVTGLLGTRHHMARQAGQATSAAKAAAARANGAKGGRPRTRNGAIP